MTAQSVRITPASTPLRLRSGKGSLLWSCAGAAIAAVAVHPQAAKAQAAPGAFQGSIIGDPANVSRGDLTATTETITITAPKATIDWSASQVDFLPEGNVATFLGSGVSDFTVLNRINADGQQVQLNGTVLGRLQDQGSTPGGKIWFYSPGGILVGGTAAFDVGGLVLTANDPVGFASSTNGFGQFTADVESNASVIISQGAKIDATAENSYVALIAPRVEQHGSVNVNGSVAYAAGQQMTMTLNQGLFDISIDVGTDDSNGIVHTGSTGGPASTSATDKHAIFITAVPKNSAIQMLLQGNLGYGTATSASIENGAIYLSAGVRHLGVFANNAIGSRIQNYRPATAQSASILFQPAQVTSKLEGQATTNFELSTVEGSTATLLEDVSLYGGARADVIASASGLIDLQKNLLLFSYGNGTPGVARIAAFSGGTVDVGLAATLQAGTPFSRSYPSEWSIVSGESLVEASGGTVEAGTLTMRAWHWGESGEDVTGGDATITANNGGSVAVFGDALLSTTVNTFGGGLATGGTSSLFIDDGTVNIAGGLSLLASGSNAGTVDASPAQGGTAQIWIGNSGGTLDVTGEARLSAVGVGGNGQLGTGSAGASATGGNALVTVWTPDSEATTLAKFGSLTLTANATGGAGDDGDGAGIGGSATGGVARVEVSGGSLDVAGLTAITANALGGNGQTGGNATGGSAGVEGDGGTTDLGTTAFIESIGVAGHANIGWGGSGGVGKGGTAYIQANAYPGNIEVPFRAATITGGTVSLHVSGNGGNGGAGNGDNIVAGAGGAGHGGLYNNQPGSGGAFILADATGGQLDFGDVTMTANGIGGTGGSGGTGQAGGAGGAAFGGFAQAGSRDMHATNLRVGSAKFGNVSMAANATGGAGGAGGTGGAQGNGGAAIAGGSITNGQFYFGGTTINAKGSVELINLAMEAIATGGSGAVGGDGTGGSNWVEAYANGSAFKATGSVAMDVSGIGGGGTAGTGGTGAAGQAVVIARASSTVDIDGMLTVTADGTGGAGVGGGGVGKGGGADESLGGIFVHNYGTMTLDSLAATADGTGGAGLGGTSAGGAGFGGLIDVATAPGGILTLGDTFLYADAFGGNTTGTGAGGNANGGTVAFGAEGGTVTLTDVMRGHAEAYGGTASAGGNGGNAEAGDVSVYAEAGGTLNVRSYTDALVTAEGGNATGGGNGGNAVGGSGEVRADGGTINFTSTTSGGGNETWIYADAWGGNGVTGGSADGGSSLLAVFNGGTINSSGPDLSVGEFELTATATGGFGTFQDGAVTGGNATVSVAQGESGVTAANVRGIYAEAAIVDVAVTGGQASLTGEDLRLAGGAIEVSAEDGGHINVGLLDAQATGSVSVAVAGAGAVSADYVNLSGWSVTLPIDFHALGIAIDTGGSFQTGNLSADEFISIATGSTAYIYGEVSAPEITITSRDIYIAEEASLGERGVTQLLTLNAVSDSPIIIGEYDSFSESIQYRLDEDGDIESATVVINAAGLGDAAAPDIHIYDVEIEGSLTNDGDDGGVSHVQLNTGGSVIINGLVLYSGAGATDLLEINAGESIQVNTSNGGRIAMIDNSEEPSGILELTADNIWAGDQALLASLAEDPDFAGRNQALANNNGENNPEGTLIAGGMTLETGETLFVQNTGTQAQPAGITVGENGLTIQATGQEPATVVAFGQRRNGDGTFTGGAEFAALVDFSTDQGPGYSQSSAFNGCSLTGCAPTPGPGGPSSGPESILGPIGLMDSPMGGSGDFGDPGGFDSEGDQNTEDEEDSEDTAGSAGGEGLPAGSDPDGENEQEEEEESEEESAASVAAKLGLISTGGLTTEQLIDDPVTSGSDSGQWGGDIDINPGE